MFCRQVTGVVFFRYINPHNQRHGVDKDEAAGELDERVGGGEEGGEEGGGGDLCCTRHTSKLCTSCQGKILKIIHEKVIYSLTLFNMIEEGIVSLYLNRGSNNFVLGNLVDFRWVGQGLRK